MAESGQKYCPKCNSVQKTFVDKELPDVNMFNVIAKKREIRCDSCKTHWFTVEIIEDVLNKSI